MRQRPDIILILTDQLSAGASSAWGWPGIRTPHLDHLIAEGVSCTRAYCTNPVCVPSRFSLMTGLMPSVGSTRSNRPGIERQPPEIMRAGLGHHLRAAGYQALYAGKQHLPAMDATDCGFEVLTTDERDGCAATAARCLGAAHDAPLFLVASFIGPHDVCYVPSLRIEPEGMTGTAARLGRETIERVSAPWIGLDAVGLRAFVEEHAPPMPANHARNGSEPPLLERIDGRHPLLGIPHRQWDATAWRLSRWIYDRLIEDVDRQIGVVLDAIALHRPEALVLFTSDHGEMNGSHQLTQKNVCYEEAIKVPLVARWPGRIAPGSRCEQLISNGLDIHPTILGAAGRAPQQGQTGRDLLPLWRGEQPPAWRDRLQIELDGGDCVHDGRRKCERYDDGTVIVRDLVADPLELERADPGVAAAIMG